MNNLCGCHPIQLSDSAFVMYSFTVLSKIIAPGNCLVPCCECKSFYSVFELDKNKQASKYMWDATYPYLQLTAELKTRQRSTTISTTKSEFFLNVLNHSGHLLLAIANKGSVDSP